MESIDVKQTFKKKNFKPANQLVETQSFKGTTRNKIAHKNKNKNKNSKARAKLFVVP